MESFNRSIDKKITTYTEVMTPWVNERQMQTTEEKDDLSTTMDASLVDTESSETESKEQDTRSRSGNDAHADDADLRPIYNEEPMAEENETLKRHYKELFDSIKTMRTKTIEHTTSLLAQNDEFKAQLQEKGFAIAALKNELRKLTGNSVNTKFAKSSILGKPPRFASQVDVYNDLSKPVTTHYLPKERESAVVKPHHVIASSESRNSSKNMPRFSSNDMVHNHYLEEAKNKTQDEGRNSKPSVMPSARSQPTANGIKPKPRSNTQTSRNWLASKNSFVTTKTVPIAEHSRNDCGAATFVVFTYERVHVEWLETGVFRSATLLTCFKLVHPAFNSGRFITTAARPYGSTTTKAQNQDGCLVTGQKCPVEKVLNGTEASKVRAFASQIAADGVDPRKQTFSFCHKPLRSWRPESRTQSENHVLSLPLDSEYQSTWLLQAINGIVIFVYLSTSSKPLDYLINSTIHQFFHRHSHWNCSQQTVSATDITKS
ncbi:hypothetical protein Tco_0575275 [Tanacetum coccineum]